MTDEEIDEQVGDLPPPARFLVKLLREQNAHQREQNAKLTEQLERVTTQLEKLQKMLFGRRSEKMPPIEKILSDAEAPTETVDGEPMPEDKEAKDKERRRHARKKSEDARAKNRTRRKKLPVLEYIVDVRDDQLPDGMSRADFRVVGEGTSIDRIEHIPSRCIVQRFQLQTLASKVGDVIIKAEPPPGVSEGCQYGPGLHAHVAVAKCSDSLPLHRIAKQLAREGSPIARSTLCTIFHRTGDALTPIYKKFLETVRHSGLVHGDETTLRVLAEDRCKKGWVWTALSDKVITYRYDASRKGQVAIDLLGNSEGYLVADGYSGYNGVTACGRKRCGCWGHARRKFFEARTSAPEADEVLEMVQALYKIERDIAAEGLVGSAEHARRRDTLSRKIVDDIESWSAARRGRYPPSTPIYEAMTYIENQGTSLRRFLDDTSIPLDNNIAERALRIIAIGRKNFLFAGHDDGAQNLAVLQSIVATCQLHEVNPYEYIRDVLIRVRIPGVKLDELMPWSWAPANDAA